MAYHCDAPGNLEGCKGRLYARALGSNSALVGCAANLFWKDIVQPHQPAVETTTRLPGAYQEKLPSLFLIWLLLTVIAPHPDLYKAWFHLAIAIPLLVLLPWRRLVIDLGDRFFQVSIGFALYAALGSLIISDADVSGHLHALRWSLEAGLLVLLLFLALPSLLTNPLYLGRFFLGCALMGSIASLIIYGLFEQFGSRLYGLGALSNPVQAGSVLLAYLVIGSFLLWRQHQELKRTDQALLLSSLALSLIAIFLSESRGPILAMILAIVYVFLVGAFTHRAWKTLMLTAVTIAAAGVAVLMFFGFDGLVQSMLERGMSHRPTLWSALLGYLPDSVLLGHGAATDLTTTAAGEQIYRETGFTEFHAHNLFIGTFVALGLIGLSFLAALLIMVVKTIVSCRGNVESKLYMLGILGVMVVLCITDTYTLIISAKAVWLFTWLPLVFLWLWARRENQIAQDGKP